MKALKPSGRRVEGTSLQGVSSTTSADQNTGSASCRVRLETTVTHGGWAEPMVGPAAFSTCRRSHDTSEVDPSERENLQNKVRDAQTQLQVAKEALSKYRERESELKADEVGIGKQLVRVTSFTETTIIDLLLAWPPREKG